jgi:hypothetical protein
MNPNSYTTYVKNIHTPVQDTIPHKCIVSGQAHIILEVSITAFLMNAAMLCLGFNNPGTVKPSYDVSGKIQQIMLIKHETSYKYMLEKFTITYSALKLTLLSFKYYAI